MIVGRDKAASERQVKVVGDQSPGIAGESGRGVQTPLGGNSAIMLQPLPDTLGIANAALFPARVEQNNDHFLIGDRGLHHQAMAGLVDVPVFDTPMSQSLLRVRRLVLLKAMWHCTVLEIWCILPFSRTCKTRVRGNETS
jgi:hypothetical protein